MESRVTKSYLSLRPPTAQMGPQSIFYRRNLPHFQLKDGIYSVVFRLYGSLPAEIVMRLQDEFRQRIQSERRRGSLPVELSALYESHFRTFDALLHASTKPDWLSYNDIARITEKAIRFWDNIRYTLICYCIMPNHVHLILSLQGQEVHTQSKKNPYVLTDILHSIKRYSARKSNAFLQRSGIFWQHESYDHIIRDSEELHRSVEYVINNPVSAGMVQRWEDWKWTYVNMEWLEKNL